MKRPRAAPALGKEVKRGHTVAFRASSRFFFQVLTTPSPRSVLHRLLSPPRARLRFGRLASAVEVGSKQEEQQEELQEEEGEQLVVGVVGVSGSLRQRLTCLSEQVLSSLGEAGWR